MFKQNDSLYYKMKLNYIKLKGVVLGDILKTDGVTESCYRVTLARKPRSHLVIIVTVRRKLP